MSLAQNVIIIVILIVIIIIIIILMKSFEEQKLAAALFHIKFTHAMVYRSTLVYPTPTTSAAYLVISRQNDSIKGGRNA